MDATGDKMLVVTNRTPINLDLNAKFSQIAKETNIPENVFPAGAARPDISSVPVYTEIPNKNAIAQSSLASSNVLFSGSDIRSNLSVRPAPADASVTFGSASLSPVVAHVS